ncbi:MAG: hypothetical protein HRT35_30770, partial [Algicola sp.]|nr:hypothetical protein [Algicola sp.]
GLTNLIDRISEQDNQAGQQYADKLLALAEQHDLPAIWLQAAIGLLLLITHLRTGDQITLTKVYFARLKNVILVNDIHELDDYVSQLESCLA